MEEEGRARGASSVTPLLESSDGGSRAVENIRGSSITAILALSTVVAECGSFTYGCATGYSAPAESGMMSDLGLSSSQFSVFASILIVGSTTGGLMSGKTADFIGRKKTMWLAQIFCTIGWLAIFFAENAWLLYFGRIFIGFGVGFYVVPVYVAEIAPKNRRGMLTACYQLMSSVGTSMTIFVGTMVSWRILAIIASASGLIQLFGLFLIPESPRWLAKVGREKALEAALQKLRGRGVDISLEAEDIREHTRFFESMEQTSKSKPTDLFQKKYASALLIGGGLMALQQLAGADALSSYLFNIFDAAGISTSLGGKAAAVIQIPGVILGVSLMDRWGRRPLLMVSTLGMCLSYLCVGIFFVMQDFKLFTDAIPILVFLGLMTFAISFVLGMASIPYIIMSEIFPIHIKGFAGSFLIFINSVCCLTTVYTFLDLLNWSHAGVFFLFGTICGLGFIFVLKLVPETRRRTLEEIQESMVQLM